MGSDGINLYNNSAQTVDAGSWGELDLDTSRHADTDWTADTTAHDIAQDVDGTVILIGNPIADYGGSYKSWRARLEKDTGSGFGAITGTETRGWADGSGGTDIATMALFSAHAGSAGHAYRVGIREDAATYGFDTPGTAGNLCGFYAPDDVCWAIGASDVGGSATYVDITLTGTGGLVEGSFSVSSNEIVLPSTDKYLILYRGRVKRNVSSDRSFSIRLSSDTGGGHGAISGTELSQHTAYYGGADDAGNSVAGVLVYSGTASEKLKLQGKTDGTDCGFIAEGCSVLVMRLPSGAEYFSGYESSAATPGTSYTAVDMDAQFVTPSGFTHSTSTNPERVTLPSATTTCLVLGVFTGQDTSGSGSASGTVYRDLTGTPTEITAAYGQGNGYSTGTTHTSFSCLIDSFSSADVLGLYGKVSASAGAVANSQLTILRLDNLGAAAGGISGAIAGTSTATGTLEGTGALSGSIAGTSTATGTLVPPVSSIDGTSAGAATATGTLSAWGYIDGTSAGAATVTGTIASAGALTGATAGTSTATGTLAASGALVGASAGTATATATLGASGALTGASAGAATATATIIGKASMVGAVAGAATTSGTLGGWAYLDGTGAGTSTGTATIGATVGITGTAAGSCTVVGICLAASSSIYDAGTVALVRTVSGTVSADRTVAETVAALRTITGTVERY